MSLVVGCVGLTRKTEAKERQARLKQRERERDENGCRIGFCDRDEGRAGHLKRRPHSTQSIICLRGGEPCLDDSLLHLRLIARALHHAFHSAGAVADRSLPECKSTAFIKHVIDAPEGERACALSSICGRAAAPFSSCADFRS